MENENEEELEEEKEIEFGEGEDDELEPLLDETPESSLEAEEPKSEEAIEPPETEIIEPAVSPLEEYITKLEEEVGARRGERETPEAYALRLEVTKLRRERKSERKEIFDKPIEPKEPVKEEFDLFYNPEEMLDFEKKFDAISKKRGLVQKDELQTTSWNDKAEDILEDFQAKHKEYNDDVLWGRFKDEFQSGKYNTRPQNPKLLTEIFSEIHNKIFLKRTISQTAMAAGKEKVQAAAHGGVTVPNTPRKPIDADLKAVLRGFSEEELEELSQ